MTTQLFMVTVPGLDVRSDWATVHDLLLDEFPDVTDVLATTIPAAVLIVYRGSASIESWFERISDVVLSRRSAVRGSGPVSKSAIARDQK